MSPVLITMRRTFGALFSRGSSALAFAAFFSASAIHFAFALEASQGASLPLPAVWAVSVAPYLPALAAFLAMDVWSEDRRTGRIDSMLTIAVSEASFTLGKFLAVWMSLVASAAGFLAVSLILCRLYVPQSLAQVSLFSFIPAMTVLALQSAMWAGASVAASAFFRHAAAAVSTALALTVALPRAIWAVLGIVSAKGRAAFGEMPLDEAVTDFSCGSVSTGHCLVCVIVAAASVFIASKAVSLHRLAGRGALKARMSVFGVILFSFTSAVLAGAAAVRLDIAFELPVASAADFDERTRKILSESSGDIEVTCFLPRSDARFRQTARLIRALRRESASLGGADIDVSYVDPAWDTPAAARLVRSGAKEGSVIFRRASRSVTVAIDGGFGELSCALAILRVTRHPLRRDICWSTGHGEMSIGDYGKFGLSDIARDLAREGYRNTEIDIAAEAGIPADCALIVVAGAKDDFSRIELGRIDAFLRGGGRLLVLAGSAEQGGVVTMLPQWGMRVKSAAIPGARTLSGTDVIVSDFSDHPVSEPFAGSRIILEKPLVFAPSAALGVKAGADSIRFSAVASAGGCGVVAAVERGAGAGSDIAIRPTRIIAIGDPAFVVNGQLAERASANRGFFMNAVAYLAGADTSTAAVDEPGRLNVDFSRATRRRFVRAGAVTIPVLMLSAMLLAGFLRRLRS